VSATLGAPPWLKAPETTAVFDALEAAGGPGCARFVGGCVRNALIGQPVEDIDIATTLAPDQVIEALKAARLRAVPTGVEHGTVTAVSGGRPYEITTLRRDVATDGRHAVVAFTDDWQADAQRRDFTLNALYAGRDGAILDPTGAGLTDARAGRIVFVGDADQRIAEDHLRILRFFRFLAWYGRGEPDATALAACAAGKNQIAGLSAERVSKELLKLLAAPDPRVAVRLMVSTGVLGAILPAPLDLKRFDVLAAMSDAPPDPVLRLAALLRDVPSDATTLGARLRLSNAVRERLAAAVAPDPAIASGIDRPGARRALYRLGRRAFIDRAMLNRAGEPAPDTAGWQALIALAEDWVRPVFPLGGEAAMAAGVPRGPRVGQVLRVVEDWWIARDFPDDPAALAQALEAAVGAT